MTEYSKMVSILAKKGDDILQTMTGAQAHLMHMSVGVSGEAGELLDAIKKHVIYNKPIDRENVIEELGDIEFFLEGLRQGLDITRDETLEANTKKLSVRYEGMRYSDQAAQDRADKAPNTIPPPHGGIQAIELMEAMFTKDELMAWAKLTAMKYRLRIGDKDAPEKEIKKIKTFEAYYKYLENGVNNVL